MASAETDHDAGLAWQVGVWDRISRLYWEEIDTRFAPVVEGVMERGAVREGERVLDLGTGTGALAAQAAAVAGAGSVLGVDVSPEMLAMARRRIESGAPAFEVQEGRAEAIPAPDDSFDAVLASLSLMYVIDREAAAREIARVLRGGGRLVAAVWAGPEACDIVRFQQTAGSFAPPPPVPGVGPGALADPSPFRDQLARSGLESRVESAVTEFEFGDFETAWEVLAGVTTAALPAERREEAQAAVREAMWPEPAQPRRFRNTTHFIVGTKQ